MKPTPRSALTSISVLAPRLGVTTRNLRYYEELGLVRSEKLGASARGFDPLMVERLTLIVALRAVGVPVEAIRRALDRQGLKHPQHQAGQALLQRALDDKRALIAALQVFVDLAPGESSSALRTLARLDLEAAAAASPSKIREASQD